MYCWCTPALYSIVALSESIICTCTYYILASVSALREKSVHCTAIAAVHINL